MAKKLSTFRLEPATIELLEKLAEKDDRSQGWIVEKAIAAYAKANGVELPKEPKPAPKKAK